MLKGKYKEINCLLGLLILSIPTYSQSGSSNTMYEYKSPHYYEGIDLSNDGRFKYYQKTEFTKSEIEGNWQIRNDSILVLDSRPQKSKIIVRESFKKDRNMTFSIRDTKGNRIHYNIYLITEKGDTTALKDQFDRTTLREKFTTFYIVDTKGLYSPIYKINSAKANFFEISMEQQRVFENEYWKYSESDIIPLGLNNQYVNYKLVKK